jgi:hypothetical protein
MYADLPGIFPEDRFKLIDDCIGKQIKDVYKDTDQLSILFEDGTYTNLKVFRDYDDIVSLENETLNEKYYHHLREVHVKMGLLTQEELDDIYKKEDDRREDETKQRELALLESLKAKYNQL